MENTDKYIIQKKEYNSKLSTFQISKETHKRVKEYCTKNNLRLRDFIEKILIKNIE
jgi:hypothetical protein